MEGSSPLYYRKILTDMEYSRMIESSSSSGESWDEKELTQFLE